jgi:hypothetical protein
MKIAVWRRVGLLKTDVSEERVAAIIRVEVKTLVKEIAADQQPSDTFLRYRYFFYTEDGGDLFFRNVGL